MRTSPTTTEPRVDYVGRVNRAIDHIVQNLHRPVPLDELARVAAFSPFHFHRVFAGITGETPARFTQRLRLERALLAMRHARGRSLLEIALDCGFASASDFSRAFKKRYGVPPSVLDLDTFCRDHRAELDAVTEASPYRLPKLEPGRNPDGFEVTLRELPPRTVAYIRVLDPYSGGVVEACERLVAWADARGLGDGRWLGYQWENPELVALSDCRYDVAVVVPDVQPEGEIGRLEFPAMCVAEVELRGDIELEQRCLDWLYGTWLPSSGYVPDDQPAFEAWHGRPFAHGLHHYELSAQIPVRR